MPSLTIHLLGPPRVELDGKPIQVDTRKAIALLAYLAVSGQPQSRETLAALFWPESPDQKARGALRRTLSVLNKALRNRWLSTGRETVELVREAGFWLDLEEYRRLMAARQAHTHGQAKVCGDCIPLLEQATALHRGDFLEGFTLRDSPAFDDWQALQSESIRRELGQAFELLVRGFDLQARPDLALQVARRWLALDSLNEAAHCELMKLYVRVGHRQDAVRQYRDLARLLRNELGVDPLEGTTWLYERVMRGEAHAEAEDFSTEDITIPSSKGDSSVLMLPMVGRARELAYLYEIYTTLNESGRFVVLEGEAGIGKSRLAEALARQCESQGAVTLSARCYEGESRLSYAPFVEILRALTQDSRLYPRVGALPPHWLAEAARLLPELQSLSRNLPPAPSLDGPGAQSRFLEGISQVILASIPTPARPGVLPGVLVLDDLQWADSASLDLLTFLVRRLQNHAVMLLGTWRKELVPEGHRLRVLLDQARRDGRGTLLPLARLQLDEVRSLVEAALAGRSDPRQLEALSERLHRESEGLPFFLVEYLAVARDQLASPGGGEAVSEGKLPLPEGVRALLEAHLRRAGETGRQLLQTAAVLGRSFDGELLRSASGRSEEEIVEALESLTSQGLIHALPSQESASLPAYDFSNEKLRSLAYEETSLARRRLLHRRVAEALQARTRAMGAVHPRVSASGRLASQIAEHYRMAGQDALAAEHFWQAGLHARGLYANAEALAHFRSALELGYPEAASLQEATGDLQILLGDYPAALRSFEQAAAGSPPHQLALIEHKVAEVYDRQGKWDLAQAHFRAALAAVPPTPASGNLLDRPDSLGRSPSDVQARIYADWSRTAHHGGQPVLARELAQKAHELAEASGDQRSQAQAHNILGMLAKDSGELAQARNEFERAYQLALSLDDPAMQAATLNNLALVLGSAGEVALALQRGEKALELLVVIGDRHREAALHNNLADQLHASGRGEEAMAHLKQAVSIYAEIGGPPGDWQPEIWKLVEW